MQTTHPQVVVIRKVEYQLAFPPVHTTLSNAAGPLFFRHVVKSSSPSGTKHAGAVVRSPQRPHVLCNKKSK